MSRRDVVAEWSRGRPRTSTTRQRCSSRWDARCRRYGPGRAV